MAFPQHQSARLSDAQLPIMLVPHVDDGSVDPDLEPDTGNGHEEPASSSAPQHPILSMQQAFAESLVEATHSDVFSKPTLRTGDAKARREELLDQAKLDPPPTALWRGRPGQRTHELCRLMAQISFGVYLLLNGMANSQTLVISILQGHIREVDEFLETTLEDLDLATKDMEERSGHLKLPMDNIALFEHMLKDCNFRLQILERNQRIDHILARSQMALKQTMWDLAEGLEATREFAIYLAEQQHGSWQRDHPDVIDTFQSMKGNTGGWFNAFVDLQAKGNSLNVIVLRLIEIVSEMGRRAGQATCNPPDCTKHHPSLQHTPQPSDSDASSITTPPASSPQIISVSAPRLSLRLSALETADLSLGVEYQLATAREAPGEEDKVTPPPELMVTSRSPPPESPPESLIESPRESPAGSPSGSPPRSPPARNPRRLSQRPEALLNLPKLEVPENDEDEEEAAPYLLQPRTYTPQPSPQPSPRFVAERSKPGAEEAYESGRSSTSSVESAAQLKIEQAKPRVKRISLKPQAQQPRVVQVRSRASLKPPPRPDPEPDSQPVSRADPAQAPEVYIAPEQGLELATMDVHAMKRTSLRQRISLKTNPPQAIQVPSPTILQRPQHPSYRGYQAPDSAYVSDMERQALGSMASINSSLADFPQPPFVHPGMIPSPHSERQFFRPVQASPYSPLQQRPHTSGTVGPHHFPAPPRNLPSAMGMSMMSSASTRTTKTAGATTVKKKRSAFGWLKKAFSLDEEERAAFEQKRNEAMTNRYYEPKSPQFLDGKRIRPRPAY
ncbi:hypothetical protein BT67DRAFT_80278 [Trichocladium antarcticum]|uniref:Uncharacterized protein n=1 Tax=Trichocladium antarcticum TaxID=1450529 RepID=A0AAN6UGU8_9PEZI|nr:hypothetical protein BT67DRAFT_80278 [Trichocladium antarcticum]